MVGGVRSLQGGAGVGSWAYVGGERLEVVDPVGVEGDAFGSVGAVRGVIGIEASCLDGKPNAVERVAVAPFEMGWPIEASEGAGVPLLPGQLGLRGDHGHRSLGRVGLGSAENDLGFGLPAVFKCEVLGPAFCHCLLKRNSFVEHPLIHACLVHILHFADVAEDHSLPFPFKDPVVAAVSVLSCPGGPFHVPGFVVPIVIHALHGPVFVRTWADVVGEGVEIVNPAWMQGDTSGPVALVGFVAGVETPGLDRHPGRVKVVALVPLEVGWPLELEKFLAEASARSGTSLGQMGVKDFRLYVAALAPAFPQGLGSFSTGKFENGPFAELFSCEVDWVHACIIYIYIWCLINQV